jgi:sugar phosphate isomerase/epimerase
MIMVFPALPSLEGQSVDANFEQFIPRYEEISLSDYKWNAGQLNLCAESLKRHGIRTGYHNHAIGFKNLGGTRGFDTLIQNTDSSLVCFEMDCRHVIHAGYDPIAYLDKYPRGLNCFTLRIWCRAIMSPQPLTRRTKNTNAEIGFGTIDWKKLFETAARHGQVKHYFVEHEGKMAHPPLEALQISYNYLVKLEVN